MKISRLMQMVAIVILGLGTIAGRAQNQEYYYSGPLNAWTEADLTPGPGYDGGFDVAFGTITETLYYNPTAQTLEEVGSVTINNPSSGSFNISNPTYPPYGIVGSADLTVGNNGTFSFDVIGTQNGNAILLDIPVPVSGSGTYNGQAFSGAWDIDLYVFVENFSPTPDSFAFSQIAQNGGVFAEPEGTVLPNGLRDGQQDGTYYYEWDQSSLVATAVPEPNSLALIGLGLATVVFCPVFRWQCGRKFAKRLNALLF